MRCPLCQKEVIEVHFQDGTTNRGWACEDCVLKEVTKRVKIHKEITSIFRDPKTGEEYGIDKKGKKVPKEDYIYDTKNDPHGWQKTGKAPKKRTYFI